MKLLPSAGAVALIVTAVLFQGETKEPGQSLHALRIEYRSPHFAPPTTQECALAEELFGIVLADPTGAIGNRRATTLSQRLSLELVRASFDGVQCVVIREVTPVRGLGLFVVKHEKRLALNAWSLQAPHADSDRHTGEIAAQLFVESDAAAVAFNTAHRTRSTASDGKALPSPGADLCHRADGLLHRFTAAIGRQCPNGRVVQLHGYSRKKRKSAAGRRATVIVSDGTRNPSSAQKIVAKLRAIFPADDRSRDVVLLYPFEVSELGGTTNVQGRLLRRLRFPGFLHLELALGPRKQLLDNAALRQRLIRALATDPEVAR